MKILFLAPEPFFQERGTPIAVRLALEVIARRSADKVDLLTYHEGSAIEIPNVKLRRIKMPGWVKGVGPGLSLKKLYCDVIFFCTAFSMLWQARRTAPFQLVHAVEESVFMACVFRLLFGIPYIYDMDSCLALQVTEKWRFLKPLKPLFSLFEKVAIRYSLAVVPVCDALAVIARGHGSKSTTVLTDIPLLDKEALNGASVNLRAEAGLSADDVVLLYIGNLERYQGISLLINSFAKVTAGNRKAHLVIIGGRDEHILLYREKAAELGLTGNVHLLGPRPVSSLNAYLCQADILVSPRTQGNNTPMKIYSYLHSGVPIVATELFTHLQVLSAEIARLAAPEAEHFGAAMLELVNNPAERQRIGAAARALAESKYTFENFERTLNQIYDQVAAELSLRRPGQF